MNSRQKINLNKENDQEYRNLYYEFITLLETIPDALLVLSPDLKVRWANRGASSTLGRPLSELADKHCYILWRNSSEPCPDCPALKCFMTGEIEVSQRSTPDGRHWDSRVLPVPDADGSVRSVISIVRDVTEHTLAEKALSENEEFFRQIFTQHEDALILFRPGLCCEAVDANPAAEALFGYSRDELIESGPFLFIEPGEHKKIVPLFLEIRTRRAFHINEIRCRRKDGKRMIVAARGNLVRIKDNEVVYCSFRDITEKMRLEEEVRSAQVKLIQANKMASLGALVSGVAHEINNPNNLIMFNGQMISEAWSDALVILKKYFEENGDFYLGGLSFSEMENASPALLSGIIDGSRRIKNIIDNLKDFARQDTACLNAPVNLNAVILSAASLLGNYIRKKTEHFHYCLEENLPAVKGNAQQIEQVIINLIMNSLQALPDRNHGIRISTCFNNEYVIFELKDEGCGMTEDVFKRLGEPFFTTKLDSGGTGLGLSISYSIVREHKGFLEFESAPGIGTTVVLRFPRGQAYG